ncbi:MAG TPA: ROK family transcriptional regulator [Pyrinomonadaceae bacterium]|nr:ROK family transcriptional regulator [Pyrinomonadaceae bacterium]
MRRIDLKKANVARSNTIRDINRQIVLNYVRERGPISRAEIAHETALQRSTVSLIVEELRVDGLIEEVSGESTGGRPPILLSLRTADAVAIGVDLGTKRTIVATSDLAGRVMEQETFETSSDAKQTTKQIIDLARKLIKRNNGTIEGIGISLPGVVDPQGKELFIPTFKWRNLPLATEISAATDLPVTMDNDANAAAQAELWFGRPEIREVRDFILVLVEDGVGTGIVFDGQVYRGENGAAGEFGHMTIGQGAPVACASGSRECWEAFASERSALARYRNLSHGQNGAGSITFGELVDLALSNDGAARAALKETAKYLGIGIANLIRGLAPEAVIVGGPIVRAWPVISEDIRNTVEGTVCRGLPSTRIIASTLGSEPTLMGAISLVLASKFASVSVT